MVVAVVVDGGLTAMGFFFGPHARISFTPLDLQGSSPDQDCGGVYLGSV